MAFDFISKYLYIYKKNKETREEIIQLQKANNTEELSKRLSTRIEFGTAGKLYKKKDRIELAI